MNDPNDNHPFVEGNGLEHWYVFNVRDQYGAIIPWTRRSREELRAMGIPEGEHHG